MASMVNLKRNAGTWEVAVAGTVHAFSTFLEAITFAAGARHG